MIKILILGSKGMAGHVLFDILSSQNKYSVYGLARGIESTDRTFNLDVTDIEGLNNIIQKNDFDIVINCIGILNKDAENNPAKAIWFNSYFPHYLENITRNTNVKIIHISTDCVFSGKRGSYTENDFRDGTGFYATSKALGELENEKDLTIRTSIIGPELNPKGIGLFHWFMTHSMDDKLQGFSQVFWSGLTTIELADIVIQSIDANLTGLRIASVVPSIDKFTLLKKFNSVFSNDLHVITEKDDYKSNKSLISTKKDFHYIISNYDVMLYNMKKYLISKSATYPHYNIH
ncbi:sugar nucleotide-binding protein [Nonlabens antarcticus]|uniref:sugar nucleotide-binding protein n=1 Tax=Nonlabens antarcticus TaxID=392714 RepID=UPI001E644147|nr:sugar nucleotide-binding protein [Nonlabens antarcticus]